MGDIPPGEITLESRPLTQTIKTQTVVKQRLLQIAEYRKLLIFLDLFLVDIPISILNKKSSRIYWKILFNQNCQFFQVGEFKLGAPPKKTAVYHQFPMEL